MLQTAQLMDAKNEAEITVYKSVGIGVQDLFAAYRAFERAREVQIGISTIDIGGGVRRV